MAQGGKKQERFHSPDSPPVVKEEWVDIDEDVAGIEKGHTVESTSEDSEPGDVHGPSVSANPLQDGLVSGCLLLNPHC